MQAHQPPLIAGFHHLVNQGGGGGEANRQALLARCQPESEGDMGLAGAARAKSDDVLAPVDPFTPGQFQNLHLVERRDRLEVEAVEAFGGRELRGLDPALDHPALSIDQFKFHQPGKELHVVQPFARTLTGQLLVLPQEGRQLQHLEVMGEKEFGSLGHAASPDT